MLKRKLPIGVDSFEKLRQENFYYVDKTALISELLNGWGEVNLFTRPRRFGKTLNMSMLKSFFEIGGKRELFTGLAIMREKELCEAYMGKYPVVFVSLKNVEGPTFGDAYNLLCRVIRNEISRFGFIEKSERISNDDRRAFDRFLQEKETRADVYDSLSMLTRLLSRHYGKNVILLIDEYDVPLDKAYEQGYYKEMLDLIRGIFNAALKTNDSLQFAVLTGCLRISRESIFTGLNNLKIHSVSDVKFDEYFGFTEAEVEKLLVDYDLTQRKEEIREWYDGYRFGEQDVYCPWDVINYCYDLLADPEAEPEAYWMNTSGNNIVRHLIDSAATGTARTEIEELIAGNTVRKQLNEQLTHGEIDKSIENIWSLLFMTGYLTMKGKPSKKVYELKIPNREVCEIYKGQILAWFQNRAKTQAPFLADLYEAFETGDAQAIERILDRQLLDTISFYDAYESFYHGFLLALLSTCADWSVISNAETGKGRSDIKAERKDRRSGFVAEIKVVKDARRLEQAGEAAIRQIEERDYPASLRRYRISDIWIYGIAFCDKECRVLAKHLNA